jgi:cytochrome c biogenesis protein CcmG/thiol:disulfide interchange protein DsbE
MKPQHILPLAVFLSIAVAFGVAFYTNLDPTETPFALKGRPVPPFELPPALEGVPGLASTDLRGQVSIVNFFAAWCAPCREEHPVLMTLAERAGVPVVGIDYKDKREAVAAWFAADGNPFSRIGFDESGRVFIDWGLGGVPETFVVDADGIVVWRYQGALNEAVVTRSLLPLVESLRR